MKNNLLVVCVLVLITLFVGVSSCGSEPPSKKPKQTTNVEKQKTPAPKPKWSEEQLAKGKSIVAAVGNEGLADIDVKKLFTMNCITCHGADGSMSMNGTKPLTESTIGLEESVTQIYYGKGLMRPYKGVFKDEQIVALAKYVEEFRK